MEGIEVYINIIIALLGLAYPILLQVISRLDEKYSSEHIVELFDKEIEFKLFKYFLISALVSILIWILKFKPLISIEEFNFLINNSASILVGINATLLVVAFFYFVRKIIIYYTPTKIIPYLKKKHIEGDSNFQYFTALSDILLLSIKQQQKNVTLTLSGFFYTAFRSIREKSKGPVEYPDVYYDVTHKAIEELAILKDKRNYSLEYSTAGGIWLLGELQGKEISEKTYAWLWRNLLLAIRYEQDDLIIYHWETAYQFYEFSLPVIFRETDYSSQNLQVSNEVEVEKRIVERSRFIEFHYMLGGLLTYKQRFNCLKRIFEHTNSQPPRYPLLPESMQEIFNFYFSLRAPYDRKYIWISHQYPFPQQSGLNADSIVRKWVSSYMAILFLRQYTIFPYLITMQPLAYPVIPATQGEIKDWIDGLDFFRQLVSEHLKNANLLNQIGLDFITAQWCVENDKPYPLEFIDELKAKLAAAYQHNALNQPISNEKVALFKSSTKNIIEPTIRKIKKVSNEIHFQDDETDKWYVNGQTMLERKDAFSENPEVHHMNFESFLASVVSTETLEGFASTFYLKRTKTYLLKPEEIFLAIEKLKINEQYVIITFGINLDYYITDLQTSGLTNEMYKNIELYSFHGSRLVTSSFFILKKADLPLVSSMPIPAEIIAKYSLGESLSEEINLYVSVIDLNNTTNEVFNENKQDKSDDELRKSVLLKIILSTEFKWKKNIKLIQIVQHSEYRQRGLANKLSEVDPIESDNEA